MTQTSRLYSGKPTIRYIDGSQLQFITHTFTVLIYFHLGFVQYYTADLDVVIAHKASAVNEELWARVDGVVFCYATDNVCLACGAFVKKYSLAKHMAARCLCEC